MNNYGFLKDPALDDSLASMSNGLLGVNRTAYRKKWGDSLTDVLLNQASLKISGRPEEKIFAYQIKLPAEIAYDMVAHGTVFFEESMPFAEV